MKFRQFFSEGRTPLAEADLLAAPASGSTDTGSASLADPQPTDEEQPPEGDGMPHGSGRPPDAMDNQLRQASAQATELLKTLMALPHPWNKNFYMFVRPLRGLVTRLEELS